MNEKSKQDASISARDLHDWNSLDVSNGRISSENCREFQATESNALLHRSPYFKEIVPVKCEVCSRVIALLQSTRMLDIEPICNDCFDWFKRESSFVQ